MKQLFWTTLILLQFLGTVAGAADKLDVDLFPFGLRTRTEAPLLIDVRFKWEGTRVLEGHLEFEFQEGNRVLGRYVSSDIALTTGEQRFRMLFPPMASPFSDSQVAVQMKFVTANGAFELTPSSLFLPTVIERSFIVAWCSARSGGDPQPQGLEQSFFFEQFAPAGNEGLRRQFSTSFARLVPEDLPAKPLPYTSFDVVVLTADAFKDTHERQLQSLARWVRGGGSVCIFVGNGLQAYHLAFLNQLADSASGPMFSAGTDGNLLWTGKKISCLHSGVGRCVIVTGTIVPEPGFNSSDWRHAMAFLWKLRGNQAREVSETGHWNTPMESWREPYPRRGGRTGGFMEMQPAYGSPFGQQFGVQTSPLGGEILTRLMPQTVRLIPFSALAVILTLFVMMIGPFDYYVLGLFRRRRYTWILFPLTSICFTLATVAMANHYLGLRDQRRSLFLVDLDSQGSVLRWNRYELLFAARDKEAVTELKDVLWAPLNSSTYQMEPGVRYRSTPNFDERRVPLYSGALPSNFKVRESLRQWRPELNRTFSFEQPPVPLPSNWRAIEEAWPDLEKIRKQLSADKPFAGDVCAITAAGQFNFDPPPTWILPDTILRPLCMAERESLFGIVSQISPTGGSNFEDASVRDEDSNDSVLLITTTVGEDVVVYRRFFHGN